MVVKTSKKVSRKVPNSFEKNKSNVNYVDKECLIHNIYIGDQTASTSKEQFSQLQKLINSLRSKNKKVLILTDLRRLGKTSLQTRKIGINIMRDLDCDKVAMFGESLLIRSLVNLMLLSSGMGYKMKFFDNEKDARNWLLLP